jgi:cell division protein FtsQ
LADPWIATVEAKRAFPSTLVLVITERKVAATVEVLTTVDATATKQYWLISTDGLWLGNVDLSQLDGVGASAPATGDANGQSVTGSDQPPAEDQTEGQAAATGPQPSLLSNANITLSQMEAMPRIRDISAGINVGLGLSVSDEGIKNALTIITGLSPEMLTQIRFISAPDRVKTTLTLRNNVEVAFGTAEDVAAKEKVVLALLKEHEGRIVYINVRVVDRVTYRSA